MFVVYIHYLNVLSLYIASNTWHNVSPLLGRGWAGLAGRALIDELRLAPITPAAQGHGLCHAVLKAIILPSPCFTRASSWLDKC